MDKGFISFHGIYDFFSIFTPDGLEWLAYALTTALLAFIVINVMVMSTALYVWFERRAIGRFQSRLGPNRWGPFGLLQPIADIIKIITKEDTTPADADRPIFNVAPVLLFTSTVLAVAVIPFGEESFLGSLNVSLLFIIGVTSLNTIAILMAGWASRNKYAMLGCMRGVAMLVSYEVPMALAMTGVVLMSGSLALSDVVAGQHVPYLLVQPLGFLVFIAAASAEMSRTPFDQIEAESELGAGYHTEYSSMKFGIFQLAEFMAPLVTSIIVTVLYLSGHSGWSFIPGPIWFVAKVFGVLFVLLWVRATWPRLRIDQIMAFAWKGLFGLALLNILVIAIEVMLLQDANGELTSGDMWQMAAVNWGIAAISVVVIVNVLGQKRLKRPTPSPSPLANMYVEAD